MCESVGGETGESGGGGWKISWACSRGDGRAAMIGSSGSSRNAAARDT